ncbi:MAG: LysM peptidoglycan-binding domain-containing protein [Clostridiales bacterium]|nr:LysM peptidoglycan-binding domain-containing protein [Clostridiales bacterium]
MKLKLSKENYFRITNETEKDLITKFNTTKDKIIRNNSDLKYYSGEWVKITSNDYITHVVKPMETLEKIAKIYDLTKEEIIVFNDLKNEKLFIGQVLKIKEKDQ